MNITPHLSYEEAVKTSSQFENIPNEHQLRNIQNYAIHLFEPLRKIIGFPILHNSLFRSKEVNEDKGGVSNSQHLCDNGAAGDLVKVKGYNYTNANIFNAIKELDYDQLIWEQGNDIEPEWVHVSYVSPDLNRREIWKTKDGKNYEKLS